ncbi:hypothetical protein ACFQMM_12475 [Saliphagus sp. GCM10025308]
MSDERDVQRIIGAAVKTGHPKQGPRRSLAEYTHDPDPASTGVSEMIVRVNADGKITTAFPEEGPDVAVWIRDEQEWLDNL